eukprot:c13074_g1_i1 orf=129-497(+)
MWKVTLTREHMPGGRRTSIEDTSFTWKEYFWDPCQICQINKASIPLLREFLSEQQGKGKTYSPFLFTLPTSSSCWESDHKSVKEFPVPSWLAKSPFGFKNSLEQERSLFERDHKRGMRWVQV